MDFEEDKLLISLYRSQLEEEKDYWDDVYDVSDCEDYDLCSEYIYDTNNHFMPRKQRAYDLDNLVLPSSFVSIDFENLYPQRVSACSVGMVKFNNGIIVDKYYTLIRPPFDYKGKRGPALTWIHGFTEDMLKNERTFDEILPEMETFIDNLPLVAHNACVERACILECCAYYNLETSIPYDDIIDTYPLSLLIEEKHGLWISGDGSHSLNVVCQRFGVKELRHHHACDDAEMCGNLLLIYPKYLSGELEIDKSACDRVSNNTLKDRKGGNYYYQALASQGHTVLSGDVLKKDLTNADPKNPFYDRIVVITGVFSVERSELACILKKMGADINTSVGRKTQFLLIGDDPGPSKIQKFDALIAEGKDVRKIYQKDLDLILSGKDYEKYYIEVPICKPKEVIPKDRKTTWPQLVEKFKQYINGDCIEFTERELRSEDYQLLSQYYKQQQKIPTTKATVLENLRRLDEADECNFRKDIITCFSEGENLSQESAYERMQNVFSKYGLLFKAKKCVLTEFGIEFDEYKIKGIHHLTIRHIPES